MRCPPRAFQPPDPNERHWDRWNRRPPSAFPGVAYPARTNTRATSSILRAPSSSTNSNRQSTSKTSSKTIVASSASLDSRLDSKRPQSIRFSEASRGHRASNTSSETRVSDRNSSKSSSTKLSTYGSSLDSKNQLPPTPEEESSHDPIQTAPSKINRRNVNRIQNSKASSALSNGSYWINGFCSSSGFSLS